MASPNLNLLVCEWCRQSPARMGMEGLLFPLARAVASAVLSEARSRCHDLVIKGEADPGNIIRVFKTLKRELCSEEEPNPS